MDKELVQLRVTKSFPGKNLGGRAGGTVRKRDALTWERASGRSENYSLQRTGRARRPNRPNKKIYIKEEGYRIPFMKGTNVLKRRLGRGHLKGGETASSACGTWGEYEK